MTTGIKTIYDSPPIQSRGHDWFAHWEHNDPDDNLVHGYGDTEISAVIGLLQASLDEDEADDVVDMAVRYWQSKQQAKK